MIEEDIMALESRLDELKSENDSLREAVRFLAKKLEIECPYEDHDFGRVKFFDRKAFKVCSWCGMRKALDIYSPFPFGDTK